MGTLCEHNLKLKPPRKLKVKRFKCDSLIKGLLLGTLKKYYSINGFKIVWVYSYMYTQRTQKHLKGKKVTRDLQRR